MIMEYRVYKVFNSEVEEPFIYSRTLSNGDVIGYFNVVDNEPEGALTQDEIIEYIKLNHVEEIE